MSAAILIFKSFIIPNFLKNFTRLGLSACLKRYYADTPKTDPNNSKLVVVQGTENEGKVRVRRARVSDLPPILRFIKANVRLMYPLLSSQPITLNNLLGDYVSRTLAQGHTMLAEQQRPQRLSQIRGLALSTAVCPWDATIMESWARCVRCPHSRDLINFAAYCLHAPSLHTKYKVQNILQVVLIVPRNASKTSEIVNMLAKSAIERGRDAGFRLIRFDVYNDYIANSLEQQNYNKEWQLSYNIPRNFMKDGPVDKSESSKSDYIKRTVTVYTVISETKR